MDDEINVEMFLDFEDVGAGLMTRVVPENRLESLTRDSILQPLEIGEDLLGDISNIDHGIITTDDANLKASNVSPTGLDDLASPYGPIDLTNNNTHSISGNGHSVQWNDFDLSWPYSLGTGDTFAFNTDEGTPEQPPGLLQATNSDMLQENQFQPAGYGCEAFANDFNFEQSLPANPSQVTPQVPQIDLDPSVATDLLCFGDVHVLHPRASRQALQNSWEQPTWSSTPLNTFDQSENQLANTSQVGQHWPHCDLDFTFTAPWQPHSVDVLEAGRFAPERSCEQMTQQTPSSFTDGFHNLKCCSLSSNIGSEASNRWSAPGCYLPRGSLMISGPIMNIEATKPAQEVLNKVNEPHLTGLPPLRSQPFLVPSTKMLENDAFVSGCRVIEDSSARVTINKRKRLLAPERRREAKKMRNIGACVRCSMLKEHCGLENPCNRCEKEQNRTDLNHGPCYRESILKVNLVRLGSGKANQSRLEFIDYLWKTPNAPPKIVQLSWRLPDKTILDLPTLEAPCQEISPRPRDLLHEEWHVEGVLKEVYLPPYASSDTARLKENLEEFIEASRPKVHEMMLNDIEDSLARLTFREADRYNQAYRSDIIDLAFRIRTTTILSAGWSSIIGNETLGTPNIDNAEQGYCGCCPAPVPLAHQLDVIFVNAMYGDERKLVKRLKDMLYKNKSKAWFEIFLAYFIIMTHLKFIHKQAMGFMRSRERTPSAGQVSHIVRDMIDKWDYSAGNMLYYFNHILNGERPFAIAAENIAKVKELGNLDDGSVAYIQEILGILGESVPEGDEPSDRWIYKLFRGS